MFYRIIVNIVHISDEILVIPNEVFPKTALPAAPPVALFNPNPKWPGGYVQVLRDQVIEEYVASKVMWRVCGKLFI